MQFLMIQNPGEAPKEGYTILGVSTTRNAGVSGTIGQFGSGNKQAINLLLRKKLEPVVFCGLLKLEFFSKQNTVNDGLVQQVYRQVYCRISGKENDGKDGKTVRYEKDLGFALEYGVYDWTQTSMALREFVSNALDRTIREEGSFEKALKEGRLSVKVVDENQVRAKAGFTRVFVPYEGDVINFHSELGKRFLHFSEPESLGQRLLPKKNRNIKFGAEGHGSAVIYKNGVFVREVSENGLPSLFDYNFGDELNLDESRNVDDYQVKSTAAAVLRLSDAESISKVFESLVKREKTWESQFDHYYLTSQNIYNSETKAKVKENWRKGWEMSFGDGVLCLKDGYFAEAVSKKGLNSVTIDSDAWMKAADQNSVRTALSVLTDNEQQGRLILPPNEYAQQAVDKTWDWIEKAGLTTGKDKPQVLCFRDIMRSGSEIFGYYENNTVYINEVHSNEGLNKRLLQTALEELTHYVTGASDMSRDFQAFLLKMIVQISES